MSKNNPLHRPGAWDAFIGAENTVNRLKMAVEASKKRNSCLSHILLYGGAGRGKTTLSKILAKETNALFIETIGSSIRKQQDIFMLMRDIDLKQRSSNGKNVILFIDEIHDIAGTDAPETLWFPILEEFIFYNNLNNAVINIENEKYTITGTQYVNDPFTIIGATTDPGMLSEPLRDRFPISCYLDPYTIKDLQRILSGYAKRAGLDITDTAALNLAKRARGTPRTAINLLLACQDRAFLSDSCITDDIVNEQMKSQGIDKEGLTRIDFQLLKALSDMPKGAGIQNLAGSSGINKTTITEMIEPLLKQRGYMAVTSRRFITDSGIDLLREKGIIKEETKEEVSK